MKFLRPKKIYVCFLSHAQIQKLGSVGRLFFGVVAKMDFAQKIVKKCENSVFRVIFVNKKKELLGSGPFSRDGRVTGNKDNCLGLMFS